MATLFTPQQAAKQLQAGKIIAYPTEAVFGLGCDPNQEAAVKEILRLKQRSPHKGMILIASDTHQLLPYIDLSPVPIHRWEAIQAHWPGPYTFVFPASHQVSEGIKGRFTTIAVRVTAHPIARQICQYFGGAIVSTSANVSDQPPIRTLAELEQQFGFDAVAMVSGRVGDQANPTSIQDAITGEMFR